MKSKYAILCVTVLLMIIAAVTWAAAPHRAAKEKLLRTLHTDRDAMDYDMLISPDGRHTAWTGHAKGGTAVYLDGKKVGTYAGVKVLWIDKRYAPIIPGIVFSKTGGHLAFVTSDGKHFRMVVDGKRGKPYDELGLPWFSSDGKVVGYAAREGKKWFVVVDGHEGKRYDCISSGLGSPIRFSPNGKSFAYEAFSGSKELLVVNNRELPHSYARDVQFSEDGAHYAHSFSSKGSSIIKDGKVIQRTSNSLYLSPNGKRLAYFVSKKDGFHLILDGKLGRSYKSVTDCAAFSPDSRHFAYTAKPLNYRYSKRVLIVDGKESKQVYGGITSLTFSPDSKHLACCVTLDAKPRILLDGKLLSISGVFNSLTFSPNSKHLAFRVGNNIALDGKKLGKPGFMYPYMGPIVFSPDSKHIACIAEQGQKEAISVDGTPRKLYDHILQNRAYFDKGNKLHYFARRSNKIYRVQEQL